MALKSTKTRILINITTELKEILESAAKKDNRSVSNYIVNLLEKDLQKFRPSENSNLIRDENLSKSSVSKNR